MQKRTDQPAGVVEGLISADGEYIYYLHDEGGNEIGHYMCSPFYGGEREDVTPDLLLYSSFEILQSFSGSLPGMRWARQGANRLL